MIKAKIIADSISNYSGTRITTFELEYPRMVHSELMTHRVFSRNAASSRAIPIDTMIKLVETETALPVYWGANKAGMQAVSEVKDTRCAKQAWLRAAKRAVESARDLQEQGLHKQIVNRVLEPFQNIKVVLTGTDFNNWFWLRNHPDAQPEMKELANLMQYQLDSHKPRAVNAGNWHMPYVTVVTDPYDDKDRFFDENNKEVSLHEALMISASCCAQVSYRKSDTSLEKAEVIFDRLIKSEPCHASPTEHQACAIGYREELTKGVTHVLNNKDRTPCSGNFRWWIQHRQLIENNAKYG